MKKLILFVISAGIFLSSEAQTWKSQIQNVSGKQMVKTLKIKPGRELKIGRLLTDEDSLKEYTYFEGIFLDGTRDSINLKLNKVRVGSDYTNGVKHLSDFPAKYYQELLPGDSNSLKMALMDMDYIQIKSSKWQKTAEDIVEPLIWASLFVMCISPLICYDYKEGAFNAERYQYWGVGCVAGLAVGFGSIILVNLIDGTKAFQFKAGWPNKKTNVWKFK